MRTSKALLVIITCLILPAFRTHADIIYSGLVNTTFTGSITLDIDGDTTTDLELAFVQTAFGNPAEIELQINYTIDHLRVIGSSFPDPEEVSNLTNGTTIGLSLAPPQDWDPGFASMMAWRQVYITPPQTVIGGAWADATNGYLGFQLISATSTNYGWIRVSVEGQVTSATLHDYAFENSTGQDIIAGAIPEPGTLSLLIGGTLLVTLGKMKKMHNQRVQATRLPMRQARA